MTLIKDLAPNAVWRFFDEITKIPRPSGHEHLVADYLEKFASERSLGFKKDRTGNVVITKPASKGYESSPGIILQSHTDMVCEKSGGMDFDFLHDAIPAYVDGEWVRARGTTLGADCGIGVAAALAALDATDAEHPAVEALFTVEEETGLTGAANLEEGMISGKYLLNLDSEEEGEIFIGCAGGINTTAIFSFTPQPVPAGYECYGVFIGGLTGGHSGGDIDKGRANSIKLLTRFLLSCAEEFDMRLASFDGGNLHNVIPREAKALFVSPPGSIGSIASRLEEFSQVVKKEYENTDSGLFMKIDPCDMATNTMDNRTQREMLLSFQGVVNGPLSMSRTMPGLVESSSNLASVKFTDDNRILVVTSQRSSVESSKQEVAASVASPFLLAGAEVSHSDGYPGWTPRPDSYLVGAVTATYKDLFGVEPSIKAIHAGLECGLFLEKFPSLEMVSFGPTMYGVHSPDERLYIPSVEKFWNLLIAVMRGLKQ